MEGTPQRSATRRWVGRVLRSRAASRLWSIAPVPRPRRFVIVCLPRTGSELLVELLDAVPGVRCEGEVLADTIAAPVGYLEGRARFARLRGARVWGGKLLGQHVMWREGAYGPGRDLFQQLARRGWTIIRLDRREVLATALSALHAQQTDRWHQRPDEHVRFEPMDLDVATIVAWLHSMDHMRRWLDAALDGVPHTTVSYEDDLRTPAGRQATIDRLCVGLGVPSAPVSPSLTTVAPVDPWDRMVDPEPLRIALAQTRFAWMLDDATRLEQDPAR